MTSFGKIILAGLVVAVVGVVLFVVSQKPTAPPVVSTPAQQSPTLATVQPEQATLSSSSTDTSDQALDKDTTALDAQMSGLDSDISASTDTQ